MSVMMYRIDWYATGWSFIGLCVRKVDFFFLIVRIISYFLRGWGLSYIINDVRSYLPSVLNVYVTQAVFCPVFN